MSSYFITRSSTETPHVQEVVVGLFHLFGLCCCCICCLLHKSGCFICLVFVVVVFVASSISQDDQAASALCQLSSSQQHAPQGNGQNILQKCFSQKTMGSKCLTVSTQEMVISYKVLCPKKEERTLF